jgi:hypothetical protein
MWLRVQEVKRSHYVYTETGVATKNRVVYVDHYVRERYAAGKGKFKKPEAQVIKERGDKIHIGGCGLDIRTVFDLFEREWMEYKHNSMLQCGRCNNVL